MEDQLQNLQARLERCEGIVNQQQDQLVQQNTKIEELRALVEAKYNEPLNHNLLQGLDPQQLQNMAGAGGLAAQLPNVSFPMLNNLPLPSGVPGFPHLDPSHAMSAVPSTMAPPDYGNAYHGGQNHGLDTLASAVEHAGHADGMDMPDDEKAGVKSKKRHHSESLQLDLDEEEIIRELHERGLIVEHPEEDARTFKGGRPPLGMGPYKRVKELYDKRKITMENWRIYYADKCKEHGYDGAFRKDLRPRLNNSKPNQMPKRPKSSPFPGSSMQDSIMRTPIATRFPASDPTKPPSEAEMKLVKTLCKELQYPVETPDAAKFVWDKAALDEENFEKLRTYLHKHRPTKMRRGKKPDGIAMFPMVFDMWALSLIESSQFKRISKYAGVEIPVAMPESELGDDGGDSELALQHMMEHHSEPMIHHQVPGMVAGMSGGAVESVMAGMGGVPPQGMPQVSGIDMNNLPPPPSMHSLPEPNMGDAPQQNLGVPDQGMNGVPGPVEDNGLPPPDGGSMQMGTTSSDM